MPHLLKLQKAGGDYEFPIMPLIEPSIQAIVDEANNTTLGFRETWTVRGSVTAATQAALITAYELLLAALDGTPTYAKFEDGSSNVIDKIDATTHDSGPFLEVVSLTSPTAGVGWMTNHFTFTLRIWGERYLTATTRHLAYTIRYSYDEAGLLTKTKSGTIRTAPGTSAQTKAEAEQFTSIGSDYIKVNHTKGDVEVLDTADTQARFSFTIRQIGKAIPAGLTTYGETSQETKRDGEIRTNKTITGRGESTATVKAALQALAPSGKVVSRVTQVDETARSVTVTWETTKSELGEIILWREALTVRGGHRPRNYVPLTGGLAPFKRTERQTPVTVEEAGTIISTKNEIKLPVLLFDRADLAEYTDTPATIVEARLPTDPTKYQRTYRRVYQLQGLDKDDVLTKVKTGRNKDLGLLTLDHTVEAV